MCFVISVRVLCVCVVPWNFIQIVKQLSALAALCAVTVCWDGVRHDVQVNIRWPLTGFAHPRLTSMNLEHSHAVNKEAIIVAAKMKAPLDYAMKRDAQLLTSDC